MSVPVALRKDSPIEFLYTAMQLVQHTLKYTNKSFPKRDIDLVKRLRDKALNVYEYLIAGNTIFVKTPEDKIMRRNYFMKARAELQSLSALLSLVKNTLAPNITEYGWSHWGELINKELPLISGIIKAEE